MGGVENWGRLFRVSLGVVENQGKFGVSTSHIWIVENGVEVYLRFGKRLLIKLLSRDVNSKIGVPSRCRVEAYKEAVRGKHPALEGVGLSIDGLRLSSEAPGSFVAQNNYYNGWKHNHCVASIFVFAPDGTIIFMVTNCAGSQHDSTLVDLGGIYEKLRLLYEDTGVKCCVDSAFSTKQRPYLIKVCTISRKSGRQKIL